MKGHNYGLCKKCGKVHIHPKGMRGKKQSLEFKENQRRRMLKSSPFKDPEVIKKMDKKKEEKKVCEICGKEFKNSSAIGRRNPDFVNFENKLIIELFGDFWHRPTEEKELVEYYRKKGWRTMVLWEHEIYQNPKRALDKIGSFIHGGTEFG
jgi:very-short-patch-repair endonuclease